MALEKLLTSILTGVMTLSSIAGSADVYAKEVVLPTVYTTVKIPKPEKYKEGTVEFLVHKYHFNEQDLHKYQSMVKQTIDLSAKNKNVAFIISKADYTFYIYNSGKLVDSFPIELGGNPYDDKQKEGDQATPEGMYKVTNKLYHSQFYLALPINYPNSADKERFEELKRKKAIPNNATIGSAIQIHGNGTGKRPTKKENGINWTDGCIGIRNDKMEQLMNYSTIGTPITIVRYDRDLRIAPK